MISKHDLKEYGFTGLYTFFEYIVISKVSNQDIECITLIKEMSASQKKDFIDYLETSSIDEEATEYLKEKTLELI
jgi:hypothetical protein